MKKYIINALLFAIAISAPAQTSRRTGSETRQRTQVTQNRPVTSRNTKERSRESNVTNRHGSTGDQKSNTTTNQTHRETSTIRTSDYRKNRSSDYRNSRTTTITNRSANQHNENMQQHKGTVVHHENRTYHSDRVYVSPRTYVRPVVYRNSHYYEHRHSHIYRSPANINVVWDVHMHREYCQIYPFVRVWRIGFGTQIYLISAREAYRYVGDVKRVYGFVDEVFYEPHTDEYHLYIGNYYPYQDFTVIVPGYIARKYSRRPERYFTKQYIWTTGYISEYDNRPEMLIKRDYQIGIY